MRLMPLTGPLLLAPGLAKMAGEGKGVSREMQQFLAQEQQKAQLQQTISALTSTCWDKCISSPGRYFSSREEACLADCAKRFLETTQVCAADGRWYAVAC